MITGEISNSANDGITAPSNLLFSSIKAVNSALTSACVNARCHVGKDVLLLGMAFTYLDTTSFSWLGVTGFCKRSAICKLGGSPRSFMSKADIKIIATSEFRLLTCVANAIPVMLGMRTSVTIRPYLSTFDLKWSRANIGSVNAKTPYPVSSRDFRKIYTISVSSSNIMIAFGADRLVVLVKMAPCKKATRLLLT